MHHPLPTVALPIVIGMALCSGAVAEQLKHSAASVAPTLEEVQGAKVRGIYDRKTVEFESGVYEGPPFVEGGAARPRVELLGGLTATGNLDATPGEERIVLLAESSGGTGEYILLAVFGRQAGKAENLGTVLVGDRVELRGLRVDDRTIVLDIVQAGPQDAMCCPTQLARRTYRLESLGLQQVASEVTGTLSLAAVADLEWTLEEWNGRRLAPGSPAPTFRVTGATVSGSGGCNRYTGAVKESAPGRISLGPLAATQMACAHGTMSVEDGFLDELKHVTSYRFLQGRLALAGEDAGRNGLLLFRR